MNYTKMTDSQKASYLKRQHTVNKAKIERQNSCKASFSPPRDVYEEYSLTHKERQEFDSMRKNIEDLKEMAQKREVAKKSPDFLDKVTTGIEDFCIAVIPWRRLNW